MIIERRVGERENGLRDVLSGCLNGDIIVLLKVDTGVLLGRVVGSLINFRFSLMI